MTITIRNYECVSIFSSLQDWKKFSLFLQDVNQKTYFWRFVSDPDLNGDYEFSTTPCQQQCSN